MVTDSLSWTEDEKRLARKQVIWCYEAGPRSAALELHNSNAITTVVLWFEDDTEEPQIKKHFSLYLIAVSVLF